MEIVHGLSNMDYQGWPGLGHCWVSHLPVQRSTLGFPIWHHSMKWLARDLVADWLPLDHFYYRSKHQHDVLTGINTYLAYGFAFPACNVSAKTTIMEVNNILFTIMVFYTTMLLTKELTCQPRKWGSGLCSWNSLVLPCSPPSWASWCSWPDRMVGRHLEDTVTALARWQCLSDIGHSSPEGCIYSESASYCGTVPPIAKIQRPRNQGVKMKRVSLTLVT
jgi:hypothetical protein